MSNIVSNFNTPGATDAILHSADGMLWVDRVELDVDKRVVNFFSKDRFVGHIAYTGVVTPGMKLSVQFDAGFQVRPG